jgi:hypothetical protein
LDVKRFDMKAWAQRQRGAFGQRLLALSVALVVLFVLYLLALPGGARAAIGEPTIPAEAAGVVDSAVSPGGQDPEALSGEDQAAPAGDQQASTDQATTAGATTNQQQPRNIVISVRIDSPGDDGPITQENVAVAVADSSNDSSTAQNGANGGSGEQAGGQQAAATGQTASSAATVTQDRAGNLVISVRINSPGNNGPISQTNTAIASSNAANTSATNQNVPVVGQMPDDGTNGTPNGSGDSSAGDPHVAVGPPARQEQPAAPASTPPATPSRLVPLPAPVETSTARAAHPSRTVPAGSASAAAPAPRAGRHSARTTATRPVASAPPAAASAPNAASSEESSPAATVTPRLHHRSTAGHAAAAHRGSVAAAAHGIRRRAADLLGSIAPHKAVPAAGRSKDVSGAVLLTLIAVLGAGLIFAGSTYLPSRRRLLNPRKWRAR